MRRTRPPNKKSRRVASRARAPTKTKGEGDVDGTHVGSDLADPDAASAEVSKGWGCTLGSLYRALPAPPQPLLRAPDGLRPGVAMYNYQKARSDADSIESSRGKNGSLCEPWVSCSRPP
jgi:hypothetical protein